jgi:DNA-binding transcriptional regulator GbsR (MarR family)
MEVIELFVLFSRALGQPRSVAEIYGLLFVSPSPLAMDDLTSRLQLSKGSASQGLKFLRDFGALRMVYVAGDRRAHYEAVAELRNLASHFLRKQILPHLDEGEARLRRLGANLGDLTPESREHLNQRLELLKSWSRNSRRVLPLVLRVLGGG